jgi:hypothetical protein
LASTSSVISSSQTKTPRLRPVSSKSEKTAPRGSETTHIRPTSGTSNGLAITPARARRAPTARLF